MSQKEINNKAKTYKKSLYSDEKNIKTKIKILLIIK